MMSAIEPDVLQIKKTVPVDGPEWLRAIREKSWARFSELGYPTTHDEDWKYTNVAPIAHTSFKTGQYFLNDAVRAKIEGVIAGFEAIPVVFVNGHYCRELSVIHDLPGGVIVKRLRDALNDGTAGSQYFEQGADDGNAAFVALNSALFQDGAFIHIPDRVVLEKPIHLIFLSMADKEPSASYLRNLIVVGASAQVRIIETYSSLEESRYFTNAVTKIVAKEGSVVEHCKIQEESKAAFHVATLQYQLERGSNVFSNSISWGGALVRNDINSVLEQGAECTLNGLYLADGKQHVDHHTTIDHAKPNAASHELYKGVLDGTASAVFNGKVIVRKDAQKTDAKQTNRNLLLSENAVINTKPELQIHADDVRCTHGATIGQLDENAMFYLRSRGIGKDEARNLLVHAFAREIIDRIHPQDLREWLDCELTKRLNALGSGKETG